MLNCQPLSKLLSKPGHGGVVKLETLDVEKGAVLIKRSQKLADIEEGSASSMTSERETESLGMIFQGTVLEVVLNQQEGRKLGSFTGKQILFADAQNTVWTRRRCASTASNGKGRECENGPAPAAAREVLRLVLTQWLGLPLIRLLSSFVGALARNKHFHSSSRHMT